MTSLTGSATWRALSAQARDMSDTTLRALFDADPRRFEHLSLTFDELLLDYSRNHLDARTVSLLVELAGEAGVEDARDALLRGDRVNRTEGRAALHTALRLPAGSSLAVDGVDIMPAVAKMRRRMRWFSDEVRSGAWRGFSGAPIRDVVHLGIGGSDLGPAMACEALAEWADGPAVHFVSNLDGAHLARTLAGREAATTLFIIASKTFTTLETMTNAKAARRWFLEHGGTSAALPRHFVAVSANAEAVHEFGIHADNLFPFADWVGGRYSLWSSIGLPLAIAVGMDAFTAMLDGGHAMDRHFADAPLPGNLPVMLALVGVFNRNFLGHCAHAVVPYAQALARFPAYLQQLEMESNGKGVDLDGNPVAGHDTAPVVFGEAGTNGQHSFFQMLHQGSTVVPVDFLLVARGSAGCLRQQQLLAASGLAQAEALMHGRDLEQTRAALGAAGLDPATVETRAPHCTFPGNRPSNTLVVPRLTPRTLGMLIALYEHKVFVQSVLWRVNAFDQFGVELGKALTGPLAAALGGEGEAAADVSTRGVLDYLRRAR